MKRFWFVLPVVLVSVSVSLVSCLDRSPDPEVSTAPKNIILFIGDGMGVAQLTAAMTIAGAPLHLESMPVTGLATTSSSDRYITDSAAGGTAIATGVKTRNGMIGMSPDTLVIENIVEIAKRNGLATGVISTSTVTHATPASFVAHVASRSSYEEIAEFYLKGTIDLFMGGGFDHFGNRSDSIDLVKKLKEEGFTVVTSPDELKGVRKGRVAGLFYPDHMPKASEGRSVSLAEMTRKAIEVLSENNKGFFLMVEGSMIDWAGHDSDTDYAVAETLDIDAALGEAMAFAKSDGNTLVILTSDHETGGMALTGGSIAERRVRAEWPTTGHTAVMVPVLSCGAGSEKFGGIMENTELFERMIWALGIK